MVRELIRKVRCRWFYFCMATLIMILACVANLSAVPPEVKLQEDPETLSVSVEYKDTLLSVDAQKATLQTVLRAIANKTNCEFVVPEDLLQREVVISCSNTDLDEVVKKVLDASGVCNYALVYGVKKAEKGKFVNQIKVVLFPTGESTGEPLTIDKKISLMPEEGPIPGPVSTELPQPGPVSTELPHPGAVSEELPQPGPVSNELP